MDLSRRWILFCLVTTYQAAFTQQQIQQQSRQSTTELTQTQVVSSESLYIGVDNHIIVRVSRTVHNLTLSLTPATTRSHSTSSHRRCSTLIHQEFFNNSVLTGRDNLLSFNFQPTSHLTDFDNTVILSLHHYNTELYTRNYTATYCRLKMVLEKQQYMITEPVNIWLYALDGNTLPVRSVNISVQIKTSENTVLSQTLVTTDRFGLSQKNFSLSELLKNISSSQYSQGLIVTAKHLYTNQDLVTQRITITRQKPLARQFEVEFTTSGYDGKGYETVPVTLNIRRPGEESFSGKARITYCQTKSTCHVIKNEEITDTPRVIAMQIDKHLAAQTGSLEVTASVVESNTGITEKVIQSIDLYPHRLSFRTHNLPTAYKPGQSLHLPLMVLKNGQPAPNLFMTLSLLSSSGEILHTTALSTSSKGEIILQWSVPSDVTGPITLKATDYHQKQPAELVHLISQSESYQQHLKSTSYRYNIGDDAEVMLSDSLSLSQRHHILVSQCGGKILTLLYSLGSLTITDNMYPCVKLELIDTQVSTSISTVTFHIDQADSYQFIVRQQAYNPGDEVELYVIHQRADNSTRTQPYTDTQILLYSSNSLLAHHNTEVLTQLASLNVEHSHNAIVTSQSSQANVSICALNESSESDRQVKLNQVSVVLNDRSSSRRIVGRRQEISQSSSQEHSFTSNLQAADHRSALIGSGPRQQLSVISESTQYSQSEISSDSLTTSRPTTSLTITSVPTTLPRLNWLDSDSQSQLRGFFPERWFADNDITGGRSKRATGDSQPCTSRVNVESGKLSNTQSCAEGEPIKLNLPNSGPADWLVAGMVVTPHHGLQLIQPIRIETETEAHLTLKDPPGDLNEGEQFQIKFSVRSSSSSPIKAHVRLDLSVEEAFCFKNLIVNSYPHVNVTLPTDSDVGNEVFTATALRRGNFTIQVELWVREVKMDIKTLHLQVSPAPRLRGRQAIRNTTPLLPSYEEPESKESSANLHLKMRYNKNDNQDRCKGFRLKVDHSILEDEPTTRSPYADYNYGLDYRKKRALPGVGGYLTTVPRHSLKICYRILQKSARGSYYIDVESFSGYKTVENLESDDESCKIQTSDMLSYEKGKIIMVENQSNHSWCCFSLVLESTSAVTEYTHTQLNQSASVRMSDSDKPGDFCLEFYNLKSESPYSDHICSQHGCLCTEGSMSTCKQIRKKSTRGATQVIADLYLKSKYAYKVKITGSDGAESQGYSVKAGVVLESYGSTHVDNGTRVHIYYKESRRSCSKFHADAEYIIMGTQQHVEHKRVISLYLDNESSVLSLDELGRREDSSKIDCFLNTLLCPTHSCSPSTDRWNRSYSRQMDQALSSSHLTGCWVKERADAGIEKSTARNVTDSADIASTINSMCRMLQSPINQQLTRDDRRILRDSTCYNDHSHIYRKHGVYQSIKRAMRSEQRRSRRRQRATGE